MSSVLLPHQAEIHRILPTTMIENIPMMKSIVLLTNTKIPGENKRERRDLDAQSENAFVCCCAGGNRNVYCRVRQ